MIRWRTLSPSSFFLFSSFLFSGSWYPSAHCPSPRLRRGAFAGVMVAVAPVWGDIRRLPHIRRRALGRARPPGSRRTWRAREAKKEPPRQIRGAHPVATVGYNLSCNAELNVGRRSADGTTDGAVDAQQVDVPTHDEHGVQSTHVNRVARFVLVCPPGVGHTRANRPAWPAIPATGDLTSVKNLPLPHPAHRGLGRDLGSFL